MKKLFEKKESLFAILWIVAYVVGMSATESISDSVFVTKLAASIVGAVLSVGMLVFSAKAGIFEYIGLCKAKQPARRMLFYIPLIILGSVNLWFGVGMKMTAAESALYVLSMIFVGFLEEVIFRGLLFRSLCKENVTVAFIVSSLTFGIGHIVNLINGSGQSVFETVTQMIYAFAIGFAFAAVAYYSHSIIPCILTHIAVNTLSAFAGEPSDTAQIITTIVLTVVSVAYAVVLIMTHRSKAANAQRR